MYFYLYFKKVLKKKFCWIPIEPSLLRVKRRLEPSNRSQIEDSSDEDRERQCDRKSLLVRIIERFSSKGGSNHRLICFGKIKVNILL